MITAECYERTVKVNVPGDHGSGFTIAHMDRSWLVTARHVVGGFNPAELEVVWRGEPVPTDLRPVPALHPDADVAVFELDYELTPGLPLHPTTNGLVYSQDAYFLGYPYGLETRAGTVNMPFVKKAIISASNTDENGMKVWYLDGFNNHGFSGGPVVFRRSGTVDWHVAGVVSGFASESIEVKGGVGEVAANTGIVVVYDIIYATEAIDAFAA